uniref:Putative conserved secreted protein n=1 Tax=Ixodes ricinus TaxID=34613 RepID=A0A6B0UP59_IXORI
MQLTLFVVIVAFVHFSCEVLSVSSPNFYGELESLLPECKTNLKTQMGQKCSEHLYQPRLLEVKLSECEFKCGDNHNNGKTMGTHGQSFILKDGTPCGPNKICIDGKCIPRCSMPFVKLLKGIK